MDFYGSWSQSTSHDSKDGVKNVYFGNDCIIAENFDGKINEHKLPISCEKITEDVPFKNSIYYTKTLEVSDENLDNVIIKTDFAIVTYDDGRIDRRFISSNYFDVITKLKKVHPNKKLNAKNKIKKCFKSRNRAIDKGHNKIKRKLRKIKIDKKSE